jgi:hypothetical protein
MFGVDACITDLDSIFSGTCRHTSTSKMTESDSHLAVAAYNMKWLGKTERDYEIDPILVVDFAANRQYLLGWIFDSIRAVSVLAVLAVSSSS